MERIWNKKKRLIIPALTASCFAALILLTVLPAFAAPAFPPVINLPAGFSPEGIATGRGTSFYVGQLHTGAIYRGDYRTGEGAILAQPPSSPRPQAVGMKVDKRTNYLFVAASTEGARVYDAATGELVKEYVMTPPSGAFPVLMNDVEVTRDAAYFTDSCSETLFKLTLGPGGRLPDSPIAQAIPLTGDFQFVYTPYPAPGYPCGLPNMNGIVATPNGDWLIVGNIATAKLFRVDPVTGASVDIHINGPADAAAYNDGLLLQGRTLYIVENFPNRIAVLEMSGDLLTADFVRYITSPDFQIPATAAFFGSHIYAVNARFDTAPLPTTTYTVVQVER